MGFVSSALGLSFPFASGAHSKVEQESGRLVLYVTLSGDISVSVLLRRHRVVRRREAVFTIG